MQIKLLTKNETLYPDEVLSPDTEWFVKLDDLGFAHLNLLSENEYDYTFLWDYYKSRNVFQRVWDKVASQIMRFIDWLSEPV